MKKKIELLKAIILKPATILKFHKARNNAITNDWACILLSAQFGFFIFQGTGMPGHSANDPWEYA